MHLGRCRARAIVLVALKRLSNDSFISGWIFNSSRAATELVASLPPSLSDPAPRHVPQTDTLRWPIYMRRTYVKVRLLISIRMDRYNFHNLEGRVPLFAFPLSFYHLNNVIARLPCAPGRFTNVHSGNNYWINIPMHALFRCSEAFCLVDFVDFT